MISESELISLNNEFIGMKNEIFKTMKRIERFLYNERDVTPGQLMYLIDARAKFEAAVNLVGSATAEFNDLLDTHRFNPDYDPRDKMKP